MNFIKLPVINTVKSAEAVTGCLSNTTKMPGYSYGIDAHKCITGSKLVSIEGSVCHGCYALKGNYNFKNVRAAQNKRLLSITSDSWVPAMVYLITKKTKPEDPYFRWHDSGDLQSEDHLLKIIEIARQTPTIKHWIPTREYAIVKTVINTLDEKFEKLPDNLVIRLSAHMVNGKAPDIGLPVSTVHTKEFSYTGANNCPASKQGNECKDCRACWDPAIKHVSYVKH